MKKLMILCVAAAALASCNDNIKPSGNVISLEREVGPFSRVAVSHGLRATVTMGDTESLEVTADDNLMQYIETYVSGSTLVVQVERGVSFKGSPTIYVTVGAIELTGVSGSGGSRINLTNTVESAGFKVDLSGGSRFEGDIVSSGKLSAVLSGGSSFKSALSATEIAMESSGGSSASLEGSAGSLSVNISGGGAIGFYDFEVDQVRATLSGGSEAKLTVNTSLKVTGSGGSMFYYKGDAAVDPSSDLTGGSKIVKVEN